MERLLGEQADAWRAGEISISDARNALIHGLHLCGGTLAHATIELASRHLQVTPPTVHTPHRSYRPACSHARRPPSLHPLPVHSLSPPWCLHPGGPIHAPRGATLTLPSVAWAQGVLEAMYTLCDDCPAACTSMLVHVSHVPEHTDTLLRAPLLACPLPPVVSAYGTFLLHALRRAAAAAASPAASTARPDAEAAAAAREAVGAFLGELLALLPEATAALRRGRGEAAEVYLQVTPCARMCSPN